MEWWSVHGLIQKLILIGGVGGGGPAFDQVKWSEQEISLKKIFGGSQILTINATKFAGLDEGATPLGPYSATRGFTW